MSPCSPNDVSLSVPTGPSGPAIPGFGTPFALKLPQISPFPTGFPEDLLDILNQLQLLIPPGALKPQLNPNFGKDVFDGIMKLLDQFMPFLMLYKFFLPILNIIVCVIEVLCALMNPFALISAINRLFSQCIPEFLNMFPVFALVIMIISLLLLIIALIEYMIQQILKIVQAILRNINALNNAFQSGDSNGVLAIANKLSSLLCVFQNLFVLFAIFNIIIDIIKDILRVAFAIPPCENSSDSGCCSPTTCPTFVKSSYTNTTGTFQYLNEVGVYTTNVFSPFFPTSNVILRNESWQLFDSAQTIVQAFSNMYNAFDVTTSPKPVFFPTDATYSAATAPAQAPYTVNLRLYYNPTAWHLPFSPFTPRPGTPRFIRFDNCIVKSVATPDLENWDNVGVPVPTGVISLAGGSGFEDDGVTVLHGFAADGVTPIAAQATLENFIHMDGYFTYNPLGPILHPTDGYVFSDATYTFQPNFEVLFNKQLVTLGCEPSVAFNRSFINNVVAGDIALKTQELSDLVNGNNGNVFPDTAAAQQCMQTAVSALRSNMTQAGVAAFQATSTLCLTKLLADTQSALNSLIGIGADPCSSTFTLSPPIQFTSENITVSVNINETNGLPLTNNLPVDVASSIASRLKGYITFGTIGDFTYDGYQVFNAEISSTVPGEGTCMVSFDNQIFCTNNIATTGSTHTLQSLPYQFIYTPVNTVGSDVNTTDGKPRRDDGDVSRDGGS